MAMRAFPSFAQLEATLVPGSIARVVKAQNAGEYCQHPEHTKQTHRFNRPRRIAEWQLLGEATYPASLYTDCTNPLGHQYPWTLLHAELQTYCSRVEPGWFLCNDTHHLDQPSSHELDVVRKKIQDIVDSIFPLLALCWVRLVSEYDLYPRYAASCQQSSIPTKGVHQGFCLLSTSLFTMWTVCTFFRSNNAFPAVSSISGNL